MTEYGFDALNDPFAEACLEDGYDPKLLGRCLEGALAGATMALWSRELYLGETKRFARAFIEVHIQRPFAGRLTTPERFLVGREIGVAAQALFDTAREGTVPAGGKYGHSQRTVAFLRRWFVLDGQVAQPRANDTSARTNDTSGGSLWATMPNS